MRKNIFFFRWWCHFDDDNYVHVLRLAHLLQSYSADRPVYLGKPSTARPIEIWDLNAPQVLTFYSGLLMILHKKTPSIFSISKRKIKNKTKLENFHESILSHFFLQVFDYFFHNVMQQLITHIPTGLHKNYPIIISGRIRT